MSSRKYAETLLTGVVAVETGIASISAKNVAIEGSTKLNEAAKPHYEALAKTRAIESGVRAHLVHNGYGYEPDNIDRKMITAATEHVEHASLGVGIPVEVMCNLNFPEKPQDLIDSCKTVVFQMQREQARKAYMEANNYDQISQSAPFPTHELVQPAIGTVLMVGLMGVAAFSVAKVAVDTNIEQRIRTSINMLKRNLSKA